MSSTPKLVLHNNSKINNTYQNGDHFTPKTFCTDYIHIPSSKECLGSDTLELSGKRVESKKKQKIRDIFKRSRKRKVVRSKRRLIIHQKEGRRKIKKNQKVNLPCSIKFVRSLAIMQMIAYINALNAKLVIAPKTIIGLRKIMKVIVRQIIYFTLILVLN